MESAAPEINPGQDDFTSNSLKMLKYASILLVFLACNARQQTGSSPNSTAATASSTTAAADSIVPARYENGQLVKVVKSDAEWKKQLTALEYDVLRKEGTEPSFRGDLVNNHEKGTFVCAGCGLPLFSSGTKFESGTGWPSFYTPLTTDCIADQTDNAYGMTRTEVECARCGGHQGHVFDDGPQPTGLRYCINSVSLNFVKD